MMASNENKLSIPQDEMDVDMETSTEGTEVLSTKATVESGKEELESLELSEAELKDIAGGNFLLRQLSDGGN